MQHANGEHDDTDALLDLSPGGGTSCDIELLDREKWGGRVRFGCQTQQIGTDDTSRNEECSKCETVPTSSIRTLQLVWIFAQ